MTVGPDLFADLGPRLRRRDPLVDSPNMTEEAKPKEKKLTPKELRILKKKQAV